MRVHITNRQEAMSVRKRNALALGEWLMGKVAGLNRGMCWHDVSIVITDDTEIAQVNRRFLGRDDATDVISFRYPRLPGDPAPCHVRASPPNLGRRHPGSRPPDDALRGACHDAEVIVNASRAAREGPKHGGISREIALYVAHGCNHLLGEEDDTGKGRGRMRRRERRWLREAGCEALLKGLIVEA